MKTIIFSFFGIILSFWGDLMEEISKLEFSREGIYIISGIIGFVVIGLIAVTIKDKIEEKKEKKQSASSPPFTHHHHHHHHHRRR